MKTYIITLIGIIVVGGLFFFFQKRDVGSPLPSPSSQRTSDTMPTPASNGQQKTPPTPSPIQSAKLPTKNEGRLVVGITDAAVSLDSIQEIRMIINAVRVRNAITQKWISLSATPRVYDLLMLDRAATVAVFSDTNVPRAIYDQVSVSLGGVSILKNGKTYSARLPSFVMIINGKIIVINGKDAFVSLDFLADKSLHMTEQGTYVFAPVVRVQVKSQSSVQIMNNSIYTTGGVTDTDYTVGMNEKGIVKANFILDRNTKLEIIDNTIHVVNVQK